MKMLGAPGSVHPGSPSATAAGSHSPLALGTAGGERIRWSELTGGELTGGVVGTGTSVLGTPSRTGGC